MPIATVDIDRRRSVKHGWRHNQSGRDTSMANPQHAILTNLAKYQWYTHLSRVEGADLGVIKQAMRNARAAGGEIGVTAPVNVCLLFGPTLLADMTDEKPNDFLPYPGYESPDGKVAK